jgi:hypothetical protein
MAWGLDASLGVPGLPQSATGQTSILTGVNAPAEMGRHISGFPGPTLRRILFEHSVLKRIRERGLSAKYLAVLLVAQDLDPTAVISETKRLAIGLEGEAPDLDRVAALLSLHLGESERGDLGVGVRGAGHHLIIQRDCLGAGDVLGSNDAHGRAHVCQHQLASYVADGPDVGTLVCILVNLDKAAFVQLDAGIFQAKPFELGRNPMATRAWSLRQTCRRGLDSWHWTGHSLNSTFFPRAFDAFLNLSSSWRFHHLEGSQGASDNNRLDAV